MSYQRIKLIIICCICWQLPGSSTTLGGLLLLSNEIHSSGEKITIKRVQIIFTSVDSFSFMFEGETDQDRKITFNFTKSSGDTTYTLLNIENEIISNDTLKTIDITFVFSLDSILLNNSMVPFRLDGYLHVTGDRNSPDIAGGVQGKHGVLPYLNRNFVVRSSNFNFRRTINEPEILIKCDYPVSILEDSAGVTVDRTYTIFLEISGLLSAITTKVNADPYLNQSDIHTLLTIGRTSKSPSGDFSIREGLTGFVQSFSVDHIKDYTENRIQELLGFDRFQVKGNYSKTKGRKLFVATKQYQKLNISLSSGIGRTFMQEIKLNYPIYKRVFWESTTDQEGNASVDMKWIFEF